MSEPENSDLGMSDQGTAPPSPDRTPTQTPTVEPMRSGSPLTIALADPRWRLSASVSPPPPSLTDTRSPTPDTALMDDVDQSIMQSMELDQDVVEDVGFGTDPFESTQALKSLGLDRDRIDVTRDEIEARSSAPTFTILRLHSEEYTRPSPEEIFQLAWIAMQVGGPHYRWWCCQCRSDNSWELNPLCVPIFGICNHQR